MEILGSKINNITISCSCLPDEETHKHLWNYLERHNNWLRHRSWSYLIVQNFAECGYTLDCCASLTYDFEKKRKMNQRNYANIFNIFKLNVCIIIYLLQLLSLDEESFLNKLNDLFEQWEVFSTLGLVLPCPQCWRTLLTLQL